MRNSKKNFQKKKQQTWKIKLDANKTWSCFVYFFLWTSIVFSAQKMFSFTVYSTIFISLHLRIKLKVFKKNVNSLTMIISIFMLIKILYLNKHLTLMIIPTMKSTKKWYSMQILMKPQLKKQRKLNYLRSENFFPLMICTLSVGRHSHRMGTVVKFLLSLKMIWKKRCFSINFNV